MYPSSIIKLIESFKKLPTIGEKSAERLTFSIINLDKDVVLDFSEALVSVKEKINECELCGNLTEQDICLICSSKNRNKKVLCVVEDPQSIIMFEKLGVYDGLYFIINGLISPLEDIGPGDINIDKLIKRIKEEKIEEIIMALKPGIEGEATTLYIIKLLEGLKVIVSRIAQGVPMGADIQYIDSLTLERALEDRKKIS